MILIDNYYLINNNEEQVEAIAVNSILFEYQ